MFAVIFLILFILKSLSCKIRLNCNFKFNIKRVNVEVPKGKDSPLHTVIR